MKNQWQLSLALAWLVVCFLINNSVRAEGPRNLATKGLSLNLVTAAPFTGIKRPGSTGSYFSAFSLFNPSWTPPTDVCPSTPPFDLNTLLDFDAIPGGSWTVEGFPTAIFNPTVLGTGSFTVTYCVNQSCSTQEIVINPLPNASWEPPSILCVNTLPFPLESMLFPDSEPGGSWLIDGSPASEFNPGLLGEGIYVVTYTVGTPPCANSLTLDVVIGPLPQADWDAPDTICIFNDPIDLNDLLGPGATAGGAWLINNMPISNIFAPSAYGPGSYVITYSIGFFPCNDTETHVIVVSDQTNPFWTAPDPVCQSPDTLQLDDLLDPGSDPGGYWLVDGQLDSILPLSIDTGTYLLTYRVGPPGCDSEYSNPITVALSPGADFTLSQDTICQNESVSATLISTVPPMATVSWQLAGGLPDPPDPLDSFLINWPDAGMYQVRLEVNAGGCIAEDQETITVLPVPPAPQPLCIESTTSSVAIGWDTLAGISDYLVFIPGIDTLLVDTNQVEITGLDPDQEITFFLLAQNAGACGSDFSDTLTCATQPCPDINLAITPPGDFCLPYPAGADTLDISVTPAFNGDGLWQGPGITDALLGRFDPSVAGPGAHTLVFTYTLDNCIWSDSITVLVAQEPTASFSASDSLCLDETLTVTFTGTAGPGAVFDWDFDGATVLSGDGAGPYELTWNTPGDRSLSLRIEEGGCQSEVFSRPVTLTAPPAPPIVDCWAAPSAVEFFWPGATDTDYQLTDLSGPPGAFSSDTSYLVQGLPLNQSVTIGLTAPGAGNCPDTTVTFSCTTQPCPEITITFNNYSVFCLPEDDTPFPIGVAVTGGQGSGWSDWQGPGITDTQGGLFNPALAGPGTHTIIFTYREGLCIYTDSLFLEVTDTPDPAFAADTPICLDDTATVTYLGDGGPNATYNWDFDDATVISGAGAGPFELQWSTAGSRTLSLNVEADGCASATTTIPVTIDPPLDAPVINCLANFSSIEFIWGLDPNPAVSYAVEVLNGPPGSFNTPQSYRVENLLPGQDIQFELTALSPNACPDVTSQITCSTIPCPEVTVEIQPIPTICLASAPDFIPLSYQLTGDSPFGLLTWSGPGIMDPDTGLWQPQPQMAGQQVPVVLTYSEDVCIYRDTLYIDVLQSPEADFMLSSPLCVEDSVLVTFTGLAPPDANFYWDFDDGIAFPGTGIGPHWVQWPVAGTKNLSLIVEAGDCASDTLSQELLLETIFLGPSITCQATFSELSFHWNEYPTAGGYEVEVLNGPSGVFPDPTTYMIEGLMPGQEVSIEVTVLSNNTCPPVTSQQTCATLPCPDVTLAIDPVDPICPTTSAEVLDLSVAITGDSPAGQLLWSGPGIINAQAGLWQWNTGMLGQRIPIVVTYQEGICHFSDTLEIEVLERPIADFQATSPVCHLEPSSVMLTADYPAGAVFSWHFDQGQADPGLGAGPHLVTWPAPGAYEVSLSVAIDGCPSDTVRRSVVVEAPLSAPLTTCEIAGDTMTFRWDPVAEAAGYTVGVLSGPAGMNLGDTAYQLTGLLPEETVTIELTALSNNSCPDEIVESTCQMPACPPVMLSIDPVGTVCLDPAADTLTLSYSLTGDTGGTLTWSGPGIIQADTGQWVPPPNLAGEDIPVTLTYTDGICVTSTTSLIPLRRRPLAQFQAASQLCLSESLFVQFTGQAGAGAVYNWNFDGATAVPGGGAGPHLLNWTDTGMRTISLVVEEDGCESEPFELDVTIDPPLALPQLSCSSTYYSVTFDWEPIENAAGYGVSVLAGPNGELNGGTAYEIDGLTPGQEVTINLVVLSNNSCPSLSQSLSCSTLSCPEVALTLTADTLLCPGEPALITLEFSDDQAGPFDVELTVGSDTYSLNAVVSGQTFSFLPSAGTVVSVTQAHLTGVPDCKLLLPPDLPIVVAQAANGGQPLAPLQLCTEQDTVIILAERLTGETPGGSWEEVSSLPSTGLAFDPATGTFRTGGQAPGLYQFRYLLSEPIVCENISSLVTIEINAEPVADAGPDRTLTCQNLDVTLGGNGTSTGPDLTYTWSALGGSPLSNTGIRTPTASNADIYTLRVEDTRTGCFDTSQVTVFSRIRNPIPITSVEPILCFGGNDGIIRVDTVLDGEPDYLYVLNEGTPQSRPEFTGLAPGNYLLQVIDTDGCLGSEEIFIPAPPALDITLVSNLGPDQELSWGGILIVEAVINFPYDTLIWLPDSLNYIGTPTRKEIIVETDVPLHITAVAFDENNCPAEADLTVNIDLSANVFVPNVFSPNGDGLNDGMTVFGGEEVEIVEHMMIFSRWGEQVFAGKNFRPNDTNFGWDGVYKGERMNVGVFAYSAKVRMINGRTIHLEGDFLLLP